jgi:hypothetical protein
MSDHKEENQRQRPNAKYKLSYENAKPGADEMVFYYNRERRLEKAPQGVRDLYEMPRRHRFNLIKPLVKTKPLAMLFFSIIVICVLILVFSLLGFTDPNDTLDGNNISIQAIQVEGSVIMAVDKSLKKRSFLDRFSAPVPPYTGAVDIVVQPVLKSGEAPEVFLHKIFFTFEPQEYYRFSIPFDADELTVILNTETKSLQLKVKTE